MKSKILILSLIVVILLSGCSGGDPWYYGCPPVPSGYDEHVKDEWINSSNIINVGDLNNTTFDHLSNDTRYWLDNHSSTIGFSITQFRDLQPDQKEAFLILKNDSIVTTNTEKYETLSAFFDPTENGHIYHEGELYECEVSWQGT